MLFNQVLLFMANFLLGTVLQCNMDPCKCDVLNVTENKNSCVETETFRVSAFPFGESSTLGLTP